jgi:hypothetical protein
MFHQSVPSTYDQMVQVLKTIASQNSTTTTLITIGNSDSGVPIYGLQIGSGPIADLVVGTHHGNEYGSTAVALGAAQSLAQNPMNGHTVYVIPVLNVSGFNGRDRYETAGSETLDANRDYPGPCATSGPFKLKSTKALADFVADKNIVSSATLHTYWPAVLYPWGMSTRDLETQYQSTFVGLTKAAAVESGYQTGNSNELLYAADGTFEDYAFWKHGIWSLLFEMGDSHNPDQDEVKQMVAVNVPGIRRFLEMAPTDRAADHGFSGRCDTRAKRRTWLE